MAKLCKFHLFNCDNVYPLSIVEDLLMATKARLGLEFSVEKHNFSLFEMSELCTKTIPAMTMDFAMFVVHAHESVLIINNDNLEYGYAKVYRALLEATGQNVIVVIGGDDNYKNETEEEQSVISRWAKRRVVHSQFSEEFMDGRKSFVFSWNKNHRVIHEEALLHYFDPRKKGQKFEYQPPQEPLSQTSSTELEKEPVEEDSTQQLSSLVSSIEMGKGMNSRAGARLKKFNTSSSSRGKNKSYLSTDTSNASSAEQRRQDFASGRSWKSLATSSERTPLRKYHYMNDQTGGGIRSSSSSSAEPRQGDYPVGRCRSTDETREQSNAEQTRDDHSFGSTTGKATFDNEHGGKFKETPSASAARTKISELAILGCNVSTDSMKSVMDVFREIGPKLNLAANPPVENFEPHEVKRYLMENHLKSCVLLIHAATVKDAYDNLDERKLEYEDLLQTAAHEVVEKVIMVICDNCSLPPKDEEIVSRTIEDMVTRAGKGHIVWLKKGKLSAEPDVLVKCLTSTSPTPQPNPQTNSLRASQEKNRDAPGSVAELFSTNSGQSQSGPLQRNPSDLGHMQQAPTTIQPLMNTYPAVLVTGKRVLLRSILRYGKISYELADLQLWDPAFIVPDFINTDLIQRYQDTPEIGVRIVQGTDGQLQWSVDPKLIEVSKSRYEGIRIAANETLMLKTRIHKGLASFQENDIDFKYGRFRIPQGIINKLKEEHFATHCGVLYIILDEEGTLRTIVKIGKINQFLTFVKLH